MLFWPFVTYRSCLRIVLRTAAILVASIIGGCVAAVVFLIVLVSTLPPTDWAYHANTLQGLGDSLAMLSALVVGASAGLLIWPIAQACLWRRRLATSIPFIYVVAILVTAGITRVAAWGGFPVSLIAVVAALVYVRKSERTFVRQHDEPTRRLSQ